MDMIRDLKRLAGLPLTEGVGSDEVYQLHHYTSAHEGARPFVSEGTPDQILKELSQHLERGDFHKLEIISPFV